MSNFIFIADTCINLYKVKCAETLSSGICTEVYFDDGTSVRLEGMTAKDFYDQIRRANNEVQSRR